MAREIEYQPLSQSRHQIRLLHIRRFVTDHNSPLVCRLEIFDRLECPPYTALCYARGTGHPTAVITLNDRDFSIQASVAMALREICLKKQHPRVWISQICINHQNDREKSYQTRHLRHVYSSATSVIAWLGPAFENSEVLFAHLAQMATMAQSHDWNGLVRLHGDFSYVQVLANAFYLLCSRPYWSRLWAIQEFAIASRVLIMCGNSTISPRMLDAIQDLIDILQEANLRRPSRRKEQLIQRLKMAFYPKSRSYMANLLARRAARQSQHGNRETFFQVLVNCLVLQLEYNHTETRDPRDRLFSLLHLSADFHHFERLLDYSHSCERIYRETAMNLLRQGNIDLFSYCQFPKRIQNLPTWAPDWSMPLRNPCCMAPWVNRFTASGDTRGKQILGETSSGKLSLKGLKVDIIKACGSIWDPDWELPLSKEGAIDFIEDILQLCKQSPRIWVTEELSDAIRVSVLDGARCPDHDLHRRIRAGQPAELLSAYERLKSCDEKQQLDDKDWLVRSLHYLHSRRPFITAAGLIGLGPSHMDEGDEVCILYGGKIPYLVRPRQGAECILIGEAFVHGCMYGEALRGNIEEKSYLIV